MILALSLMVAAGLAWRLNLMLYHPQQYERYHRFELGLVRAEPAAARRLAAEGERALAWLARTARKKHEGRRGGRLLQAPAQGYPADAPGACCTGA
ncbi:MAG TPA: hypothetical protein VFF52_09135 [Isosphaeraceae bacterium]|nr:hypothetical protein [Isosphaeraceae bacterium]